MSECVRAAGFGWALCSRATHHAALYATDHALCNPCPARPRFDRAICIYDIEKLAKGRECFKRVRDCARAAITSLALDPRTNVLLAGSLEGTLRVWSLEGRCLEKFEGLSGRPVSAVHVRQTHAWWATGRFDRVNVCDPRAPANVTQYVAQQNHLLEHQVGRVWRRGGTG